MDKIINSKAVVLRDSFPAREFWDTPTLLQKQDTLGFDEKMRLMGRFVSTWEFDGDPADPAAWGQLDTFSELVPLVAAINILAVERINGSKN